MGYKYAKNNPLQPDLWGHAAHLNPACSRLENLSSCITKLREEMGFILPNIHVTVAAQSRAQIDPVLYSMVERSPERYGR